MNKNMNISNDIIKSVLKGLIECSGNDQETVELFKRQLEIIEEEWKIYEETGSTQDLMDWSRYLLEISLVLFKTAKQEFGWDGDFFNNIMEGEEKIEKLKETETETGEWVYDDEEIIVDEETGEGIEWEYYNEEEGEE